MFRKRVCVILETKKGILVALHKFNTKYSLLGGGIKWGEAPKKALMRELHEELGITLKNVQHLFTTNIGLQKHLVYHATMDGKPTKYSWEVKQLGFVEHNVPLTDSTRKILQLWKEQHEHKQPRKRTTTTKRKRRIRGKTTSRT